MAYWITKFGTTNLPARAQMQDVGTGKAHSGLVTLPDGSAFDALGTATSRVTPWQLSVTGAIVAASEAALYTAGTALYALVGRVDTLYRTPDGGTADSQQVRARCLSADFARDVRHRLWAQPTLTFEVQEPVWSGTADVTTTGTLTTGGTYGFANAGNAPVWDPVFAIKAGAAITSLQLQCSSVGYEAHLCFGTAYGTGSTGGTIPTGGTLVIDCGDYSVINNGTAAYSRFELGASHKIDAWAKLFPAGPGTQFVVTFNGGGTALVTGTFRSAYA